MPRTGDTYSLPSGTEAVTEELISSSKFNSAIGDLEAEQNLIRPVVHGGTGVSSYSALLTALDAVSRAQRVGTISMFGGTSAPSGALECDGSAVSRTTYADLFAAIGTTWGSGNGSTTFNLPDLRDEFVRGKGASRAVGSSQSDAISAHTHAANPPNTRFTTNTDSHNHGGTSTGGASFSLSIRRTEGPLDTVVAYGGLSGGIGSGTHSRISTSGAGSGSPQDLTYSGNHSHSIPNDSHNHYVDVNLPEFDTASTGGSETRPRNKAVMFIIWH